MKIAVLGEDRRFSCLREMLKMRGHTIAETGEETELAVGMWPIQDAPEGARLASCGPVRAAEGVLDLMTDEIYLGEIAAQTAEGALFCAMEKLDRALGTTRCLVVGWGRIGKALTGYLLALGAEAAVLTRRKEAFDEIRKAGAVPMSEADRALEGRHLALNTTPAMMLDRLSLRSARQDCLLMELASAPYGIDFAAAEELGLTVLRKAGLPGRYCPQSAAQSILGGLLRGGALRE